MSLKAFHLIFVTLLTALSFGSILWGVTAVLAGIFVIFYGVYFLKKLKKISYL